MRSVLPAVLLVSLVALAGCVGSLPGGDDGPTLAEVTLPDGVTEDEVNVTEVTEGHEAALADRSFTSRLTYSMESATGDDSLEMTARVAAGGLPRSATLNGTDQSTALYLTEETEYRRATVAGETRYEVRERTPEAISFVPVSPSGASFIQQFATAVNFTPTDARVEDGTTVVVLSGEGIVPTYRENVTEFDATMLVDERGVVREVTMTVEFVGDPDGTLTFEYAVDAVSETTVEEPGWLDEAEREAE